MQDKYFIKDFIKDFLWKTIIEELQKAYLI
jgi:hypothetical protein